MKNHYYTNERSQQIVIFLLKAYGIRKIIASPGTTNITLVASMQQDPYFEIYSSVDERSAAYLACGLSAESGEAVVLTCTGATASRNYMPGLTEAYYRKLPILAVTATQGTNKIGHLIAQNIDRTVLPNDIAKLSVNIPVCKDTDDEWNCEVLVNKALLELKRHGGGPVHINLATTYSRDYSIKVLPGARVIKRIMPCDVFPMFPNGRVAICVGSHKSWTNDEIRALERFCASHDAVVFCDHTSGYRGKYCVQLALILGQRHLRSELNKLDLMIHIGDVSGDYDGMKFDVQEVWRVSEDGELRDTFRKLRYVFEMSELSFFNHYANDEVSGDTYLKLCKDEYNRIYQNIQDLPFGNIWVAQQISGLLPENSVLHLGILNSLRSWNMFELPASVSSYSNVGGFGIDGSLSSLVGASWASPNKIYYGVIGDLAFFYDINVLGNRYVRNNIRIILINNARGTEFRNYDHPGSYFEEKADDYIAAAGHYGNKSRVFIKHYAEDLGYEYLSASTKEEFLEISPRFLTPELTDKPMIFEIFTDSEDESNALKMIRESVVDPSLVRIKSIKEVARRLLGDTGIRLIKTVLNK